MFFDNAQDGEELPGLIQNMFIDRKTKKNVYNVAKNQFVLD
jgi:hypothetical protein